MSASQKRVDVTTTMLSRFRSVRLAGYADILSAKISNLRNEEVEISKDFRKCLVAMVTLCEAPNNDPKSRDYSLGPQSHLSLTDHDFTL